jgi:hypothetical protein
VEGRVGVLYLSGTCLYGSIYLSVYVSAVTTTTVLYLSGTCLYGSLYLSVRVCSVSPSGMPSGRCL